MAEKSGELDIYNENDAVSTAAGAKQDEYLEGRTDEYESSDIENQDDTNDEATDETEQIRAKIEETRSQMGETIDAIQEKLSIQNITDQVKDQVSEHINSALETAKESVYDATIGNIGKVGKFMQNVGKEFSKSDIGKTARKNPFPLLLVGLGLGLLAYEGFGGKSRSSYRRKNYNLRKPEDNRSQSSSGYSLSSATGKIGDAAGSAYDSVSGAASNAYGTVTDATGNALQTVSGAASSAYSKVGDLAGNAYEKVGDYSSQAREQYEYHIEENPLAVGAVALALGAAVGLSIPATRYESELMGEYRQQLLDKAQTAAGGLVDKVKEVASEAQKTIKDEVQTAVSETKKTINEEAKNQGLTQ